MYAYIKYAFYCKLLIPETQWEGLGESCRRYSSLSGFHRSWTFHQTPACPVGRRWWWRGRAAAAEKQWTSWSWAEKPPGYSETASDCEKQEEERRGVKWMHTDCTHTRAEILHWPGDLEDPQQSDTAEHRNPKRRHDFQLDQNSFSYSSAHNKAVKAVEEGNKIGLEPETVHLH